MSRSETNGYSKRLMTRSVGDRQDWTCPTCSAAVATPFCPACGEREPHPQELTLPGMLHHAVQAFSNLDGRLWWTVGVLLRRPGQLTVLFHDGSRKPYIGPFTLFLLTNVL